MTTYGRYFEFRMSPDPGHRLGRFLSPATGTAIPIGAPVSATNTPVNADGRETVALATGHTPRLPGRDGIAVFEYAFNPTAGFDPVLTVPADLSDIPLGVGIQVVHGTEVKVVLKNIAANTVFFGRTYTDARTFVAPADLSTLAVGDLLCPGTGNATAGFWTKVAGGQEADAWLIVTAIDSARVDVEAQMLF